MNERDPAPRFASAPTTRVAAALLACGWAANHFVALLPAYRVQLDLTAAQIASAFGVYACGLLPGLLRGGPLSDRRGRRAVLLPGGLVAVIGTLVLLLGRAHFAALLGGRLLVGLGAGAVFSAGSAWMLGLGGARASQQTGIALSLGFGLGPLASGAIGVVTGAPTAAPYLLLLPIVVAALLAAASVTARSGGAPARADAPPPAADAQAPMPMAAFLAQVAPVAPWIFAFPSLSFVTFAGEVSRGSARAPLLVGAVAAVTLLAGALAPRVLRGATPALGLAVGAVGIFGGLAAASAGWFGGVLAAGVLLGVGHGTVLAAALQLVAARVPDRVRGRYLGLTYALAYVGFAVPLLLAWVTPVLGETRAVVTLGALAAGLAVREVRRARR